MKLTRCVQCVITVSAVAFVSDSFNVDVKTAVVNQGQKGTAFGYTAEFIQGGSGDTRLVVGAPRQNVTSRDMSGIHYYCDPSRPASCRFSASLYQQHCRPTSGGDRCVYPITTNGNRYGEDAELFGLAMAKADNSTVVICGPLWSDFRWWDRYERMFPIGRCQILPPSSAVSEGVLAYDVYRKYLADDEVEGKQLYYGMALFGFSAEGDGKGKVVIGAPGFSISRGGVVVLDTRTGEYNRMEQILNPEPDILLGYTVTVGNFCGPDRFCFAVSNRQVMGKVYLIEFTAQKTFTTLWEKGGEDYASFGSALCAVDVNGDGWADLLVGAPTYIAHDTRSYDEGRVFVFISDGEVQNGKDNFNMVTELSGDAVKFSRFGSAIGNIGDINRDSYNDVAVGAPLEEMGAGALYIYLGGPNGPTNKHSQKILGHEFTPPLSSFGSHISKPISAISSYGYPDFAVGAPESDAVVFLRTRLIVNAEVKIMKLPNPLATRNAACPPGMDDRVAARVSGCVNVSFCLTYTYSAAGRPARIDTLQFDVDFEVDKLLTSEASRRLRLYVNGLTTTTVRVSSEGGQCSHFIAVLREDQINRKPFVPLQLRANFSLNTTSYSGIAPILNHSMPNSDVEQVKFQNECGEDGVCHTDLVLSGRVLHSSSEDTDPFNVVNSTDRVELILDLVNVGETAFGVQLTVNISSRIEFWTATGDSAVFCDTVEVSLLLCNNWWLPLGRNATTQIRLQFLADSVPLEAQSRLIEFLVEAMPIENPEISRANNVKRLQSRTAIVADLKLDGRPDPLTLHVDDADQADLAVTHKLLVANLGPSFVPQTHLNVTVPFRDGAGLLLLQSNVTIKYEDGVVIECPQVTSTGSLLNPTTTPTSSTTITTTTATTTTTPAGGGKATTTTSEDDDPFGSVKPSKRRRRRQAGSVQNDDVGDDDSDRQLRMDCGSRYGCRVYQCAMLALQPNHKAEVNVAVKIMRSAISFPGNVDTLLYITTTSVAEPDHPLFDPWDRPRILQVETSIKRVSSGDEINIWIIIGGVVGGLLLLILIAVVAWRLGFFRRKDKARLERLKRQSGFYEGRGRSMKKSQGASGTGNDGAEAEKQ